MEMKTCTRCEETKAIEDFVKATNTLDKRRGHCKKCNSLYYAKRRIEQYEKVREYEKKNHRKRSLMSLYGMTEEDYETKLQEQEGCCAICGIHHTQTPERIKLAVDHCHFTGKVRGLLCSNCNKGLGLFKDCQEVLEKASNYLSKYRESHAE